MNAHRKAAAGAQACVMIHFPGREIASTTSGRHPAEAIARMLSHLPLSLLFEVLLRLRLQDLTAVEATCTGLRDALRRADFLDAWLKASCYLRTGECTIIAAAWKRASGIHTECWTVLSVHPHRREGAVLSLPRGQSLSREPRPHDSSDSEGADGRHDLHRPRGGHWWWAVGHLSAGA